MTLNRFMGLIKFKNILKQRKRVILPTSAQRTNTIVVECIYIIGWTYIVLSTSDPELNFFFQSYNICPPTQSYNTKTFIQHWKRQTPLQSEHVQKLLSCLITMIEPEKEKHHYYHRKNWLAIKCCWDMWCKASPCQIWIKITAWRNSTINQRVGLLKEGTPRRIFYCSRLLRRVIKLSANSNSSFNDWINFPFSPSQCIHCPTCWDRWSIR